MAGKEKRLFISLTLTLEHDLSQHLVVSKMAVAYVYEKWKRFCEFVKLNNYCSFQNSRFPTQTLTGITLANRRYRNIIENAANALKCHVYIHRQLGLNTPHIVSNHSTFQSTHIIFQLMLCR